MSVRFDGIYAQKGTATYRAYLRFYEDGTILVGLIFANIYNSWGWMHKGDETFTLKGKWKKIKRKKISFEANEGDLSKGANNLKSIKHISAQGKAKSYRLNLDFNTGENQFSDSSMEFEFINFHRLKNLIYKIII
ncbi:MAG: hypothetical protein EU547_01765 [Promethearchaeota archaeon]|nr:MAG: hypothetical protein EU547_01765 [Candidatus Lokiarchaeota archaeon]